MNDRIKLAEAMGWTNIRMKYVAMDGQSYPFGCVPRNVNDKHLKEQIPDPYTNANDDYAVLEWLRAEDNKPWQYTLSQLDYGTRRYKWDYQIGDYARAALRALEKTADRGRDDET